VSLNLYRRHRRECKAGHPEDHFSSEFDERKKSWRRCQCAIVVSGTLNRKFRRQSTGQWEWDHARASAAALESAGTWEGAITPKPHVIPEPAPRRITIEHASKTFVVEFQEAAAPATQKKYRLMLTRLRQFSEQHGYVMIDQWQPSDVREFRTSWGICPQTAARRMSMLKAFFEYCLSNEWITRNPAKAVKNPKTRDSADKRNEQKLPFTDDEIRRMYDACPRYASEARYRYKWRGDDLADFISLSIYTGLRISDVALFRIDRLQPNGEIFLRTTKGGTHVCTWVPQWLQDRIRARAKQHGANIFGDHTTKDLDVITDLWRRKLNRLWDMCGPWTHEPTPHRFRHTFARILLQKPGVTVRDVAELLGNTEDMVRKRYSAWVRERQDRVTKILQEAFDERPRPRIVSIR
jgi:integrase